VALQSMNKALVDPSWHFRNSFSSKQLATFFELETQFASALGVRALESPIFAECLLCKPGLKCSAFPSFCCVSADDKDRFMLFGKINDHHKYWRHVETHGEKGKALATRWKEVQTEGKATTALPTLRAPTLRPAVTVNRPKAADTIEQIGKKLPRTNCTICSTASLAKRNHHPSLGA
jgi:hypothetical protein